MPQVHGALCHGVIGIIPGWHSVFWYSNLESSLGSMTNDNEIPQMSLCGAETTLKQLTRIYSVLAPWHLRQGEQGPLGNE